MKEFNIGDHVRVVSHIIFDGTLYNTTGWIIGTCTISGCKAYRVDFKESIDRIGRIYRGRLLNGTEFKMFDNEIEVIEYAKSNKNFKLKIGE